MARSLPRILSLVRAWAALRGGRGRASIQGVSEASPLRARILVVDDEPELGRALVAMLGDPWIERVEWVGSAPEALAQLMFSEYDLVVSDVTMPRVDGLELLRAIEELDPALPVILLAAANETSAVVEAVRARAFDLLWKPVDRAALHEAVQRGLAARSEALRVREVEAAERQRLERRSLLLSLVFDAGSDGVLTWDVDGRLVDLSPSVALLTGVDLERALIEGNAELFEREPFGGVIEDRIRSLAHGLASTHSQEVVVRTLEGPAPARLTLSVCELQPAESGEQPVRWIVGLLQPPRREDLRERLRRADRLAGAAMLASGAAHEIKNDLGPLLACLSMLEHAGVADPEIAEVLGTASDCVRRIELAVGRICAPFRAPFRAPFQPSARAPGQAPIAEGAGASARVASGSHAWFEPAPRRPGPAPRALALAQVVRDSVTFVRRSGRDSRIAIELEIADELPPVWARAEDVHQIVVNLLVNAIEAFEGFERRPAERAPVRVRVESEGDRVLLAVEDDGPGVSPELQARVFEAFFTTKGARGTGLGLTVVRDLVRSLGGDLAIVSTPTIAGTCVQVRL